MFPSVLLSAALAAYIPGHVALSSPSPLPRNETLSFTSHPLIGLAPVPRTPEEVQAARKPNYISWVEERLKKRGTLAARWEFAEHAYLADSIPRSGPDGNLLPPLYKFSLPNGLNITYGQISALAGDFYATDQPISDGPNMADRISRFTKAFSSLAFDTTRQPSEAVAILETAAQETSEFVKAVEKGQDPSEVYNTLPDVTVTYQAITWSRESGSPGYLGLAQINWDHFGADARTAYDAGHFAALAVAQQGDLLMAYATNAFADHFLEDAFSAGHLRTPRRVLHSNLGLADLCAKKMHDEDNAIGLQVANPRGATWHAYGDKRYLDSVNADNRNHAFNALQISTAEIFTAWKTGLVPEYGKYRAWEEAPTLDSAGGNQELAPLFRPDGARRLSLQNRRAWSFTNFYTYATTLIEIAAGDLWDYPIKIDT